MRIEDLGVVDLADFDLLVLCGKTLLTSGTN